MIPDLLSVLEHAIPEDRRKRRPRWEDVVLVQNFGPVPVVPGGTDLPLPSSRGFNLVVFGRGAEPAFYGKCRPSGDPEARREAEIASLLASHPEAREHVPEARVSSGGGLQILVTRYLTGPRLDALLKKTSPADTVRLLEEVLGVCATLGEIARDHGSPAASTRVSLAEEAVPFRRLLRDPSRLEPSALSALEAVLGEASPVPRFPQHGDLWPQNVVRHRGRWYVLDFELFGAIGVPLYDVFQLVRTTSRFRSPGVRAADTWFERMARGDGEAVAFRRLLADRARRYALDPTTDGLAALVYYAVDVAGRALLRRAARPVAFRHLEFLDRIARGLLHGADLPAIFFGEPHPDRETAPPPGPSSGQPASSSS